MTKSFFINIRKIFNLINKVFGYFCTLLVILMSITVFVVVILRYFFGINFIWLQESYVWMHAFIFMLGAGYTYLKDEHVRIDILYSNYNKKFKKLINLLGNIFLIIPFLFITWKYSLPFVLKSFQMKEVSREAGGLEMIFILKSAILFFVFLMFIQVISKIINDFEKNNHDP